MRKKFISISLIASILLTTIFQCLFPVTVCALSVGGLQSTIASIIISLMLECGVAPVNNTWLQTLNTSYGVSSNIGTIQDCINSGLLTQTASGLIDSGLASAIESAPAYTELGLSEIFTTSVDDVAMGVSAASGGVNLANTAINVGTVGTIGAFAGAVGVGVGLGVIANKLINKFSDYIKYGAPITFSEMMSSSPMGGQLWFNPIKDAKYFRSFRQENNTVGICYKVGDRIRFYVYNIGSNNITEYNERSYNNSNQLTWNRDYTISDVAPGYAVGSGYYVYLSDAPDFKNFTNYKYFDNLADAENYINDIISGNVQYDGVISPDLIGQLGNYTDPSEIKSIVPDGYDMNPVDMNDYQDYVDGANQNTEDGNINQPIQGEEFDNLIDSLLVEPSIIPDQGITDPVVPDRPIIPEQPDVPGKDPITGEQQSEVLGGITTPDLRSVFPFCIPFDLYNIFGVLKYEGREAPVIVWEANFMDATYPVIIDLTPYEDAASILRLMELLLFIVGLAVATRSLIGAGG